jgi:predicted NAD/FAD-dependent oxidoreductase
MPNSLSDGPGKIAVIGAGIAGIAAARELSSHGAQVTVFEKSRGFGGRCATKRWEGHVVDHGAQYFTIRDKSFRAALQECGPELLTIAKPILTEAGQPIPADQRHYHLRGNSHVARTLAAGLDVRTETPVAPCTQAEDGRWLVAGEAFDRVICTAPLPQTTVLAGVPPCSRVTYIPCLTAVFIYAGDPRGAAAEHYAISDRSGHPLAWSACENHKDSRVQPGFTVMIAQASGSFSYKRFEEAPESWVAELQSEMEARWHLRSEAFVKVLPHRWRYARVESPTTGTDLPKGWYFAGDALRGSRVESAWLAGVDVARQAVHET